MNTLFVDKEIKYDGSQLCPHWIYRNYGLLGDSIISFIGEVEVKLDKMVDIEDIINNEPIYSKSMLNFIIERFDTSIEEMVFIQRLFVSIIKENIEKTNKNIIRKGDDLFFDGRKLSVSIATKSLTSSLIHTALNIDKKDAPIQASDLTEIGIKDVKQLAYGIMNDFKSENESVKNAVCKVRGVFE